MKISGAVLLFFLINHQNSVQESINVTSSNLKIINGTIQVDPYPGNVSEVPMFMDLYDSENNSHSIDTFYKIPEGFPRLGFPYEFYSHQFYLYTINLTSEISNISNVWDQADYVYWRCDNLYASLVKNSDCESQDRYSYTNSMQCESFFECKTGNLPKIVNFDFLYNSMPIRDFFMTYLMIFVLVIGIVFSGLNIRIFLKKNSLRNPFSVLILFQSVYTIAYIIFYNVFTCLYPFGSSFLGFDVKNEIYINFSISSNRVAEFPAGNIPYAMYTMSSFEMEMIRFFKAMLRFSVAVAPFWSPRKILVKHAFILCFVIFLIGFFLSFFLVFDGIAIYDNSNNLLNYFTNFCNHYEASTNFLYLFDGPSCIPHYILSDELFPLCIIILIMDIFSFFLLKFRMGKLNFSNARKKSEQILSLFIITDLIYAIVVMLRKTIYFLASYATVIKLLLDFSYRLRYSIVWSLYFDIEFNQTIKCIFYSLDMILCQLLLRRMEKVIGENGNEKNDDWLDKLMMKFSKKFFKKVLHNKTMMVAPVALAQNKVNIT